MACCPEGALGQLGTEGYKCKVCYLKLNMYIHKMKPN